MTYHRLTVLLGVLLLYVVCPIGGCVQAHAQAGVGRGGPRTASGSAGGCQRTAVEEALDDMMKRLDETQSRELAAWWETQARKAWKREGACRERGSQLQAENIDLGYNVTMLEIDLEYCERGKKQCKKGKDMCEIDKDQSMKDREHCNTETTGQRGDVATLKSELGRCERGKKWCDEDKE